MIMEGELVVPSAGHAITTSAAAAPARPPLAPLKMPPSPHILTSSPFMTPKSPTPTPPNEAPSLQARPRSASKRKHDDDDNAFSQTASAVLGHRIPNFPAKSVTTAITPSVPTEPVLSDGQTAHCRPGKDTHRPQRKRQRRKGHADSNNSHDGAMEINNHYSHLQSKDLPPQTSQLLQRSPNQGLPSMMNDRELQTQLLTLKQQHQLQQQMLIHQFREQQVRLSQEQDKQMATHIQQRQHELIEQQKVLEEQQRLEKEKAEQLLLEQIKNKKKEEESAIASSEVKLKLQEFVLNKKQREAHGKLAGSPTQYRHWATTHHSSLDQHSPPQSGLSPPYRPTHLLGQYEDFPLRKTVSDSNLKVRNKLKEKVVQRSSPLLRRKDVPSKRKTPLQIDTTLSNSNPDSGPNSPPNNAHHMAGDSSGVVVKEEGGPFPLQMMSKMVINQSMPNISIGLRDPTNPAAAAGTPANPPDPAHRGSLATEAELRARAAVHYVMPLTHPVLPGHGTLSFCPSLPVIDSEFTPPTSPAYINTQMKTIEQARAAKSAAAAVSVGAGASAASNGSGAQGGSAGGSGSGSGERGGGGAAPYTVPNSLPMTALTDAQARLHRRQLARTQSAPLPLGHPLLTQPNLLLAHQEQLLKENQKLYLKQRLQNAVLQRVGSKNHMMENVDEEAEARLVQEMKEVREREEDDVVVISDREDSCPPPAHDGSPDATPGGGGAEGKDYLIRHREALMRQRTVSGESPPSVGVHPHRPLARTQSSPVVAVPMSPPQQMLTAEHGKLTFTTGLAYDTLMLKHACICGNNANHPEHAGRLQSIWARLHETGLVNQCERIKSRKATMEEIQSCHGEAYTLLYGTNSINRPKLEPKLLETLPSRFCLLPCGGVGVDSDTVWNDLHTASAARMATGCVIELCYRVALGDLLNGMAVVRPPGHHAEPDQAMGFCYFNSIAVAAKQLQERLKMERILILDWDVHHGNSTQQIFYEDKGVLYMSLHRHDSGNFFPGTGAPEECGADDGLGFTVNVPWKGTLNPPMGDAEYLAAFRTVVMPIAREFNPEIVLVSAGFDAAAGHPPPLGGYMLSCQMFGHLTNQLQTLANGKVVLVLEGGYDLPSICDASEWCMRALLGEELPPLKEEELRRRPCQVAVETLTTVMKCQVPHWPCLQKTTGSLSYSLLEAQQREREEADTVSAFASLSVVREVNQGEGFGPDSTSCDTTEPMEES